MSAFRNDNYLCPNCGQKECSVFIITSVGTEAVRCGNCELDYYYGNTPDSETCNPPEMLNGARELVALLFEKMNKEREQIAIQKANNSKISPENKKYLDIEL